MTSPVDTLGLYDPWDELALLTHQFNLRQQAKPCPGCGQLILWRMQQGRRTRYTLDWRRHECPETARQAARARRAQARRLQQELDAAFEHHIR